MAPFTGLYLSNELPDAFPVHRVRNVGGSIREVFVDVRGETLCEIEGEPGTPSILQYLDDVGIALRDGAEIEVNLRLEPWLRDVGASLAKGQMLTIDYGYEAVEVERFPRGTALAHYRHAASEDFYQRIGMQDLTAHVCWTALERFGARAGLRMVERTTQRDFITRWGWKEMGREMLSQPGIRHGELEAFDRLGRLEDGLGGLGVLVMARGRRGEAR
jgi:SAM-dependent MidA family methyltransferase